MTKIIFGSLKASPTGNTEPDTIRQTRVVRKDGPKVIRTLDARSDAFGDDLTYVFRKNVEKARRENKRLTGKLGIYPYQAMSDRSS